MKIATLTDNLNQTHKDVFYIETMDDFDEFRKLSEDANGDEVALALKTDIPESRWDHLFDASLGGMQSGVVTSNILGGNPIYLSGAILSTKLERIRQLINDGNIVIVNQRGGYFPIYDSIEIKIVEIAEYVANKSQYVNIKENTKIINLENDLYLEPVAVKFMRERDPNYSTIRKLKKFNFLELSEIFKRFKENGGELAYIYTTGLDTEQMYRYTNALIIAGVKKVQFDFNSGIDTKIQLFLDTIKLCDIEMEYQSIQFGV